MVFTGMALASTMIIASNSNVKPLPGLAQAQRRAQDPPEGPAQRPLEGDAHRGGLVGGAQHGSPPRGGQELPQRLRLLAGPPDGHVARLRAPPEHGMHPGFGVDAGGDPAAGRLALRPAMGQDREGGGRECRP